MLAKAGSEVPSANDLKLFKLSWRASRVQDWKNYLNKSTWLAGKSPFSIGNTHLQRISKGPSSIAMLVGGFNQPMNEKYENVKLKNIWNHHLVEGVVRGGWEDWLNILGNGIRLFRGGTNGQDFSKSVLVSYVFSEMVVIPVNVYCPLKMRKPTLISMSQYGQGQNNLQLSPSLQRSFCHWPYWCSSLPMRQQKSVVSFCLHWTQPVWKLAVIMWFRQKVKALIRNSTTTSILESQVWKAQTQTGFNQGMTWDDQWPSYSLQSWKWTSPSLKIPPVSWIDSCFGGDLVRSLRLTHPQPALLSRRQLPAFQNWGYYVSSFPGGYTSGCRFWISQGATCQRPAHSEVMLQELSRWDGFPNDSTWPHKQHSARKIDEKM